MSKIQFVFSKMPPQGSNKSLINECVSLTIGLSLLDIRGRTLIMNNSGLLYNAHVSDKNINQSRK